MFKMPGYDRAALFHYDHITLLCKTNHMFAQQPETVLAMVPTGRKSCQYVIQKTVLLTQTFKDVL